MVKKMNGRANNIKIQKFNEKCKNLNYFFNVEYFEGLNFDFDHDEKDEEEETFKKRNNVIRDFELVNAMKPISNKVYGEEVSTITLETNYPGLLIGIGSSHGFGGLGEIALGFTFDYVTGTPYIPGSSVKGTLRSAFRYEDYIIDTLYEIQEDNNIEYNNDDIEKIKFKIFGDDSGSESTKVFERDVFFDGIIPKEFENKKIMAIDNITPHRQDSKLLELAEPNPITMIKVKPKIKFMFQFLLRDLEFKNGTKTIKITKHEKEQLFKTILTDLGIGAKTNVGYGYLSE